MKKQQKEGLVASSHEFFAAVRKIKIPFRV
jgi:hypothetical protein